MRLNGIESAKECVLQFSAELNKFERHNYFDVIKEYSEDDLLEAYTNVKKMLK